MKRMTTLAGPGAKSPIERRPRRLVIWELLVLVAGVALGLWLFTKDLKDPGTGKRWVMAIVVVLGGCSVVGPPLLLWERRRSKAVWRAGRILWFAQGTAAWLMWPPMVAVRVRGEGIGQTSTGVCYFYGTPLMALYVTLALLAGGWIRPRRGRRRRRTSWRERFGLLLGLAWACTGLYLLATLYLGDLK